MGIFSVGYTPREMREEIIDLESENRRLENEVDRLKEQLKKFTDLRTPDSCERGEWCYGCQYSFCETAGTDIFTFTKVVFCGYGKCKNFSPKKGG